MLDSAKSTETAPLTLPTRCTMLIPKRKLPPTPAPASHRTDVSDSHTVCSHDVVPILSAPLCRHSPSPTPCTLIRAEPVPAALAICTPLIDALSTDTAPDKLPTRRPTLSTARTLPRAMDPDRHSADVSDAHPVCSHPVPPDRTDPVHALDPMLAPCTLTTLVPVQIALPAATLSPPRSADTAAERLPTRLPTLSDTRKLPCELDPARHNAELSDTQPVRSHALCPTRPDTECPASPIRAP